MDDVRIYELLRAILGAAVWRALNEFNEATARTFAEMNKRGMFDSSVALIEQQRLAIAHADLLIRAVGETLFAELPRLVPDWDKQTLGRLQGLVAEPLLGALQHFLSTLGRFAKLRGDSQAQSAETIRKVFELHHSALNARLEIYVEDRRRQHVLSLLNEVESRLAADEQAEVLSALREAKTEAGNKSPNEGRLKQALEVLSKAIPAINSASDLGGKVHEVLRWFT